MKKCSTTLAIRKMQIRATLKFHFHPIRMAPSYETSSDKCWQGCGVPIETAGGVVGWRSRCGSQHEGSSLKCKQSFRRPGLLLVGMCLCAAQVPTPLCLL